MRCTQLNETSSNKLYNENKNAIKGGIIFLSRSTALALYKSKPSHMSYTFREINFVAF